MICSCCYTEKPEEEYPKTPSGTRSYCKACYSYIRWWNRQKPESKAVHNEASRRWVRENKDKRREVNKRSRELNRGTMERWIECNRGVRNFHSSVRRARKRNATPAWANLEEIRYIYSLAKERGLVVDHIVPLVHPLVCGLHVESNLRCITPELNSRKGNRYYPDTLPICDKRKKGK